jgi:hypothetical protein
MTREDDGDENYSNDTSMMMMMTTTMRVSGRDNTLLKLLARKMNFKFAYVDAKMMENERNVSMTGAMGLQMLQKRVRVFFMCTL